MVGGRLQVEKLRAVPWRHLGPLAIGALAVRVAYLLAIVDGRPAQSDAYQYLDIARHVGAGDGFAMQWPQVSVHATAFRPPVYPTLLGAWVFVFGDSVTTARVLNAVIGVGVVLATYAVARRLGNERGALIAAWLVCLYPPLLANDATTLAEPLALLLLLAIVWATSEGRWWSVGAFAGLLTLTKPSAQGLVVMLAVAALAIGFRRRGDEPWRRPSLLNAGHVVVAAAILVVPWVIRNQVQVGSASIVTSNGFNLFAVYGELAQERGEFVDSTTDPALQSLDFRLLRFDEAEWNDELTRRARASLVDRPGYVVTTLGRNVVHWFELSPTENDLPEVLDGRDLDFRHLTLPLFYVVTPLRPRRHRPRLRRAGSDWASSPSRCRSPTSRPRRWCSSRRLACGHRST